MVDVAWWLVLAVLLPCQVLADYYEDLGLTDECSDKEIKKNFRELSRKFSPLSHDDIIQSLLSLLSSLLSSIVFNRYHPDHNTSPDAKDRYQRVNRAYEVLSDPKKRKIYDMKGDEGVVQLEEEQNRPESVNPFGMFFRDMRSSTRGSDKRMNLRISLADVYNGNTHTVTVHKQKVCKRCKGSGAFDKSDVVKCPKCGGKGSTMQRVQLAPGFVQQIQNPCQHCGGTGKVVQRQCPACGGRRVSQGDSQLEVMIEKGIAEGHEIVFDMEADQSPDLLPGDVIFQVTTQPHPVFKRDGDNLQTTLKIPLLDALVGFERRIEHLDGRQVVISREAVTAHGDKMKLSKEGMPRHNVPSEHGDLIVTFEVVFPKFLTTKQRETLRQTLKTGE